MVDINEIRARNARMMADMQKRTEEAVSKLEMPAQDENADSAEEERARRAAELAAANEQRQREVLSQMMGEEFARQTAAMQEMVSQEVQRQAASAAAQLQQDALGALFGDDAALFSAALDTLAQTEDDEDNEEEEQELPPEELYDYLESKLGEIDALEEPQPQAYHIPALWERFCIALSGIISTVNEHKLDELDVEERVPLFVQQITSLIGNSWGISGREDLIETLLYLSRAGYRARFAAYAEAASPEELFGDDMAEEDREGIVRGHAFVQHFKDKYGADFLLGWDIGRAAMITRWGYFAGWLTQAEAEQLLSDMGQVAANELSGWREFARSYLFGGAFWKEVCAAYDGKSYLDTLTDAAGKLLSDGPEGAWTHTPWAKA